MSDALPWAVVEDDHDPHLKHVVPINDLRDHTFDANGTPCWCGARQDEHVIIHNSADKRELYERGEARVA